MHKLWRHQQTCSVPATMLMTWHTSPLRRVISCSVHGLLYIRAIEVHVLSHKVTWPADYHRWRRRQTTQRDASQTTHDASHRSTNHRCHQVVCRHNCQALVDVLHDSQSVNQWARMNLSSPCHVGLEAQHSCILQVLLSLPWSSSISSLSPSHCIGAFCAANCEVACLYTVACLKALTHRFLLFWSLIYVSPLNYLHDGVMMLTAAMLTNRPSSAQSCHVCVMFFSYSILTCLESVMNTFNSQKCRHRNRYIHYTIAALLDKWFELRGGVDESSTATRAHLSNSVTWQSRDAHHFIDHVFTSIWPLHVHSESNFACFRKKVLSMRYLA